MSRPSGGTSVDGIVAAGTSIQAFNLDGTQAARVLCTFCFGGEWGPSGKYLYLQQIFGGWLAVPLPEGQALPDFPDGGLPQEGIENWGVSLVAGSGTFLGTSFARGPDPFVYAISRQSVHRNLYRIPIR